MDAPWTPTTPIPEADEEDEEIGVTTITITPCHDVNDTNTTSTSVADAPPPPSGQVVDVVVSVMPPDCSKRHPIDVCCVVDISGSMDDLAQYEGDDGQMTNDGASAHLW